MKDFQASLETLRRDATEAALIRDLATDRKKREMFDRLARHLYQLADEVEQAMAKARNEDPVPESGRARQVGRDADPRRRAAFH